MRSRSTRWHPRYVPRDGLIRCGTSPGWRSSTCAVRQLELRSRRALAVGIAALTVLLALNLAFDQGVVGSRLGVS